jgi:hypothetical protein
MLLDTVRAPLDLPGNKSASAQPAALARRLLGVFAALIIVCAFDFKAESSGAAALFQGSVYAVYLILLVRILVAAIRHEISVRSLLVLLTSIFLFMAESSLVGLYDDQVPYFILTNCVAPFIYATAALATFIVLQAARDHLSAFLSIVRVACLVFGLLHFFVVLWVLGGIDLSVSRYEWLNAAVIPSLGLAGVAVVCRLRKSDILVLLVQLTIAVISVTRTLLVVMVVQIAVVFAARPSLIVRRAPLRAIAILCLCAATLWGIDQLSGAGLSARWVDRMTVSKKFDYDPTALTRNSETEYMLQAFTASPTTVLFGNGLAAYTWSIGRDAIIIGEVMGWANINGAEIGIGHENHVSILFVAGILGGGALLFVQILNVFQSIGLIRRLTDGETAYDDDLVRIGVWGALTVIGVFAVGFLSGTINDRPMCLWYGIGTGMLYWVRGAAKTPAGYGAPSVPEVRAIGSRGVDARSTSP